MYLQTSVFSPFKINTKKKKKKKKKPELNSKLSRPFCTNLMSVTSFVHKLAVLNSVQHSPYCCVTKSTFSACHETYLIIGYDKFGVRTHSRLRNFCYATYVNQTDYCSHQLMSAISSVPLERTGCVQYFVILCFETL